MTSLVNAKKQQIERVGETRYNCHGSKMTIIEYIDSQNIVVQFQNGYTIKSTYSNFTKEQCKSLYDETVCDVGYIGEGVYETMKGTSQSPEYIAWTSMLRRCYYKTAQNKRNTYVGCSVCEEWHNFQNFGRWYDENYYEIKEEKMCLDKDILIKGNKVYSPENCIFVPNNINVLFTKSDAKRGVYPIGVYKRKRNNKFVAQCKNGIQKNQITLGEFDTVEKAFNTYKSYKEQIIKNIADKYKNQIPEKLYKAMYTYEVEITD